MAKEDYLFGFLGGLNFSSRLSEVAFMSMLQKHIEGGEWKKRYGSIEELFDSGDLPFSVATYRRRLKDLDQIGPEIQGMLSTRLKTTWADVRMIERVLTTEQKEALKKDKVVPLGDRKVAFTPENFDVIMAHFNNVASNAAIAEKKLAGIDVEHRKSEKPLLKKIEELEAMNVMPETPEHIQEAWDAIEKHVNDLDLMVRKLVWKNKTITAELRADITSVGKIQGIQQRVQKTLNDLWFEWVNDFGKEE